MAKYLPRRSDPDGRLRRQDPGGFLLFWKPDDDKAFHRFAYPVLVRDMDLHPDGIRVATAHYDRNIRIVSLSAKA